jgi:hypothetical protein
MSDDAVQHRYLLGLPRGRGRVFLSWRLLSSDALDSGFHVERRRAGAKWARATSSPVLDSTTFVDTPPERGAWQYRIATEGGGGSEWVEVDAGGTPSTVAMSARLDPADHVDGMAMGELTNDGRVGYVLRVVRGRTTWLCAYGNECGRLWEIDTRLPGSGGWDGTARHVPFLCWDVNGDGRTEVIFHSSKRSQPMESYEEAGPEECVTAVDGETGELVWDAPWPAREPRVMMNVGQLRGRDEAASVVVLDGTYGPVALTAIDGREGAVAWRAEQVRPGGHNVDVGDIDLDGIQEVICGGVCYNGDGSVRWEAEPFGHTDISKPARIDPAREGLQIWYAVESGNPGVYFVDNQGRTLFKEPFRHAHYGWIARHTTAVAGLQPHTAEDARHEYGAADAGMREEGHFPIFLPDGSHWLNLTDWQRKNFVPVHWDEGPEVVFIIRKEDKRVVRLRPDGEIEDVAEGKLPEGGRYGSNLVCADVIGDFRENIVTVDTDDHRLVVLANPTLAGRRRRSPFEDFEYRHDRSQHGGGYYRYLSPPG